LFIANFPNMDGMLEAGRVSASIGNESDYGSAHGRLQQPTVLAACGVIGDNRTPPQGLEMDAVAE
jgi:hypothetical protein